MQSHQQISDWFATPILSNKIEDRLADQIEESVLKYLDKLKLSNDKNVNTDFYNPILSIKNELPVLYSFIMHNYNNYVEKTGLGKIDADITNNWIQDYKKDHLHVRHRHPDSNVSGIYWVRADPGAPVTRFYNPNPFLEWTNYARLNTTYHTIEDVRYSPMKGVLLLFPSYIEHEVDKNDSGAIRTTIAFNL